MGDGERGAPSVAEVGDGDAVDGEAAGVGVRPVDASRSGSSPPDEAIAYAERIWRAGGEAELHVWPGGYHAFDAWMPQAALSQALTRARHDWLRRLLAT